MTSLLLLSLFGCPSDKESAGDDDDDDDTDEEDSGYGDNPIVPEEYRLLWDLDAESCEETGAIVYFVFAGQIDEDDHLTGQESWYWFHSGEGWEGDCVDVFDVEGDPGEINWSEEPCSGCDREFLADWTLDETNKGCSYGYEDILEGLDEDEDPSRDEEEYYTDVQLDPLSPAGNVNAQMLAFSFVQDDDQTRQWAGRPNARGDYLPLDEDDYLSAATLTWDVDAPLCIAFR